MKFRIMNNNKLLLSIIFYLTSTYTFSQAYHTQAISDDIYTVQVNKNNDWSSYPIIALNGNDYVHISFDRISEDSMNRLRYRIIHCDAYWKRSSSISEIDYLSGFNDNPIDDYASSLNTTVEYTHFAINMPNNDVNVKLSGNYVVEVYEDGAPDEVLLTACFSVVEPQVSIAPSITSNTDIDTNKGHQQLSFSILHQNLNIRDPFTELKIFAWQNNRLDTERHQIKPTYVSSDRLIYEHNRNLIFEAGNEYRRFETSSYRYNGLNVEHIEYNRPNYTMYIVPDKIRAGRSYSYDQDQNGRFYIRSNDTNDSEVESDYFNTVFTLPMDSPIGEDIFINGNFTDNNFTDKYRMKYDEEHRQYYIALLLKQGLYNYQYLTKSGASYSTAKIEGNYFETENEYQIFVYYRPSGQRYDSLIGVQNIQSRSK